MTEPRPAEPSRTDVPTFAAAATQAHPSSLDQIAEGLLHLRAEAGNPSFAIIARRVSRLRAQRGLPPSECEPGRVTVYDCFRAGRRRMQPELITDIATALGASPDVARTWAQACTSVQLRTDAAAVVTVRAELPTSPGPFVGRGSTIRQLVRTAEQSAGPVFVLHGMAGSGKTRLAVRAADAMIRAGLAVQPIVAELRGHHADKPPADVRALLDAVLRSLGVPGREIPRTLRDKRRLLATVARNRRCVLVLDDAHDAAQVSALVPRSAVPVLVTSRHRLTDLRHSIPVPVGGLTDEEAVQLLRGITGRTAGEADAEGGADADRDAALDLVRASGLLPLSVGLAATRVAARPEWSLADHLDTLRSRREALQLDDDLHLGLSLSYRPLRADAARALRLLAVHPVGELDVAACTALFGQDAAPFLQELSDRHLTMERSPGRYSLHDLTHAFALSRSYDEDRPVDREAALNRLHQHFMLSVSAAAQALGVGGNPRFDLSESTHAFADEQQAAGWITTEFDTLLALTSHAVGTGRTCTAMAISEALSFWLIRSCDRADVVELHRHALRAAEQAGDSTGIARAALAVGQVLVRSNAFSAALAQLSRAHAIFEATGDHLDASRALTALAMIDVHQGRLDQAIDRFGQVVETAVSQGDVMREGIALDNLAVAYIRAGRHQEALSCQRRSLELSAGSGDTYTRANVLLNMAGMHQVLDQPDEAFALAQEALDLALELNLRPTQAYALSTLGSALIDLSRLDAASDALGRSLTIATEVGDRVLESAVTGHLGRLKLTRGDTEEARALLMQAAGIAADVGATYEEACAWDTLAGVELTAQDPHAAKRLWTRALDGFEAMGSPEAARVRERLAGLR